MLKSLFSILLFSLVTHAASSPGFDVTEKYVQIALANDASKLKGHGSVKCRYHILVNNYGTDLEYEASAQNAKAAAQLLALQCIKHRCQQVGQWTMGGLNQLDQVSNADNTEFMKAQGISEEEIQRVLANRRTADRQKISKLTCETSTPLARMVIVDSCFVQPVACNE